jgi:hypothetical protein
MSSRLGNEGVGCVVLLGGIVSKQTLARITVMKGLLPRKLPGGVA